MNNNTGTGKADKIRGLFEKGRLMLTDFRVERLSRVGHKTGIGVALAFIGAVLLCGTLFIFQPFSTDKQNEGTAVNEEKFSSPITYCAIVIDGRNAVNLASSEEAQSVLDKLSLHYQTSGASLIDVSYSESVILDEQEGVDPVLVNAEDAVSILLTGTKEPLTYTVKSGDNLWDIAIKNDMTVEQIEAANPNADPDHLKIGSVLNLFELKPYVHVILTERIASDTNIDYPVEYEETSALYKGETRVKVAGTCGKRRVQEETVKENGVVIFSKELESTVISEPKKQVVLKGTKSLSTLVGTGQFSSPMGYLEVSSGFGSRGGARHSGVDLRNPKGTPIYAVDDGVVHYAGYRGSYGNLVILSHGKGIETLYAHCDTMLVKIGDVVRKGDQIATVGITGRATGYHLHFEVRKNGVPVNPMNYL